MGKGKKKTKRKKRGGKKQKDDSDSEGPTHEQMEMARLAAANRTEDPLKNWTRPQNEECPICMLPLPHEPSESSYCVICGKTVCWGCMIGTAEAHAEGGDEEKAVEKITTCPYCRSKTTCYDDKFWLEKEMKRANAGDGESMHVIGGYYFDGEMGLKQDKAEGLQWYHRSMEAGSGHAAFNLSRCFKYGDGVKQDIEKAIEYSQKSAGHGFAPSYVQLGRLLLGRGEIEEGMLNLRKASMCGMNEKFIFDKLKIGFKYGFITKEEYAFTLRENQAACNEMKSGNREMAKMLLRG